MSVQKASPLFGKINVYDPKGGKQRVEIYILLNQRVENMKVGIAIDGSASMQSNFASNIPKAFRQPGQNVMEPVVRSLTKFLSDRSGDGSSNAIYWAVGPGGKEIEIVGDINTESVNTMEVEGPKKKAWGGDTHLNPVLTHYVKEFENAAWTFLLIITDGEFRDMDDVKRTCMDVAQEIVDGKRKECKFVIVGVGKEVNVEQIEELDDMFDDTPFEDKIDLWDGKIASEMKDLTEIFEEVDFGVTLPGKVKILDDKGNVVLDHTDGFGQQLEFTVVEGTKYVTVEIAGEKIKQSLE